MPRKKVAQPDTTRYARDRLQVVEKLDILSEGANGEPVLIEGVDVSQFNLTYKELEYVLNYLNNGLNATVAYKKTFPEKAGNKQVSHAAHQYVNDSKIFSVLQHLLKYSINRQLQFSPSLLMSNIQMWLHYDISSFYTTDGSAIPLEEIDEDARQLISGIDYTVNGRTGDRYTIYRLPDKFKALQELSSIVKFLQSLQMANGNQDEEAETKKKEIWEKFKKYNPKDDEIKDVTE